MDPEMQEDGITYVRSVLPDGTPVWDLPGCLEDEAEAELEKRSRTAEAPNP